MIAHEGRGLQLEARETRSEMGLPAQFDTSMFCSGLQEQFGDERPAAAQLDMTVRSWDTACN